MKYQLKRPQIGMTCFVFDGATWRRSDFFKNTLTWKNNSILGLIYPDPIVPHVYRSHLLPQCNIQKMRCAFGHEFEGNTPEGGYIKIQVPSINTSLYSHFVDFDLLEECCILPDSTTQQQKEVFASMILLQPSYLVS